MAYNILIFGASYGSLLATKLLLGGHIVSGWHWGSNLVWEHELGGPRENSNEWTTGISYTGGDWDVGIGIFAYPGLNWAWFRAQISHTCTHHWKGFHLMNSVVLSFGNCDRLRR